MSEWTANWPINWVGNSVRPSDPPLETRQHYAISAVLSGGTFLAGVHAAPLLRLTHSVDGGTLTVNGRLIFTRFGSSEFV